MTTMGRYCKAYYVRQLSDYPEWRPHLDRLRPETTDVDGREVETPRTELKEDDILYVQENLIVTDGIFLDEHVVFDALSPAWEAFCRTSLAFEVPADLLDEIVPDVITEGAEPAPPVEATA